MPWTASPQVKPDVQYAEKNPIMGSPWIWAFSALLTLTWPCAAQDHNVLTAAEKADGYVQLFNGKDLSGWKIYKSNATPKGWLVKSENGITHLETATGGQDNLISAQNDWQNFDLKVEWRVPNRGNSGIFIRYMEIDSWAGASGPEAQVVDINHSDGQTTLHRAGTCYDMFPLNPGHETWWKPTGEWNQFRIVAYNNHVAHYGNGKKLLEYDFNSAAFATAFAASKYRDYPNYKTVHPGAIFVQHHGETGIAFRDMRIKKLTQDPWGDGSQYLLPSGLLQEDLTFEQNIFPVAVSLNRPRKSSGQAEFLPGMRTRAAQLSIWKVSGLLTPEILLGRRP